MLILECFIFYLKDTVTCSHYIYSVAIADMGYYAQAHEIMPNHKII